MLLFICYIVHENIRVCHLVLSLSFAYGVRRVRGGVILAAPPRVTGASLRLSVGFGLRDWLPHAPFRPRGRLPVSGGVWDCENQVGP